MSVAELLRKETQPLHERIESIDVMKALASGEIDLGRYKKLLLRLLPFYSSIEERLSELVAPDPRLKFSERRKVPWLESDLHYLDVESAAGRRSFAEIPPLQSLSDALGALYVLEGATLGGQIISKRLEAGLGITPSTGGAFYYGYGAKTSQMWKSFKGVLDDYTFNSGSDEEIVHSAKATFSSLHGWISQMR